MIQSSLKNKEIIMVSTLLSIKINTIPLSFDESVLLNDQQIEVQINHSENLN